MCQEALRAKNMLHVGRVAVKVLRDLEQTSKNAAALVSQLVSLRSALRQGSVVAQKIQEAEDDAAAVSNAIRGIMANGCLVLDPGITGTGFGILAEYTFNNSRVVLDEQRLTECADKALLAVPAAGHQFAGGPSAGSGALSAGAVALFTQVSIVPDLRRIRDV